MYLSHQIGGPHTGRGGAIKGRKMTMPLESVSIFRQLTRTISRIVAPELIDKLYNESPGRTVVLIQPAGGASQSFWEMTRGVVSVGMGLGPVVGRTVGEGCGLSVTGGGVGVVGTT
jgi:hypothetical protein